MRILGKIILVLLLLVVVVAACGVGYLYLAYPNVPPASAFTIDPTPERLERGRYLAVNVSGCIACHSHRDFSYFAGPLTPGSEGKGGEVFPLGSAGTLHARNITPALIGSWTDGELLRAVTSGVSRDGTPLFPLMPHPRFGQMDEEDVHAILAYTRSLAAIEGGVPERTLNFPMNLIVRTIPTAAAFKPRPSPSDKVAYGAYMVNAAVCADCHTPVDDRGQPVPGREFAGGFELTTGGGYRVRAANITPDADTGIGSWTEQQFIDKFTAFETPAGQALGDMEQRQNTQMPWTFYAGMTREDLSAIYAYLRTLKPVINRVNKFPDAK